jgi:DNA (cytosine-5)-methyltransferase 1
MLTYLGIAERFKPRWLVWENVPGVLSSNGGKDFGSFLGALGELGYEWAYRVLDAQWFGVAQRRRRVFVVAHLGEGNIAAKVLFESESVRRNPAPSREARQGVATNVAPSLTASNDPSRSPQSSEVTQQVNAVLEAINAGIPDVCATIDCGLSKQVGKQLTQQAESFYFPIPIHDQATRHSGKHGDKQDGKGNGLGVGKPGDPCPTLTKGDKHAVLYENHPNDSRVTGPHDVAPSCVSRYGTGGGNVPLVQESMAFQQNTRDEVRYINGDGAIAGALAAETGAKQQNYIHIQQSNEAIAFEPGIATREGNKSRFVKELSPTLRKEMGDNQVAVAVDIYNQALGVKSQTLRSGASSIEHSGGVINPSERMAVRRLTPRECERLQGFPDDHTLIPWRNKPADQCPDGPRYKALGNLMAVPCMAWIGERIEWIENERQGAV